MCKNQGFAHQSTACETERENNFLCNCDDFDFLSAIPTSLSAMMINYRGLNVSLSDYWPARANLAPETLGILSKPQGGRLRGTGA